MNDAIYMISGILAGGAATAMGGLVGIKAGQTEGYREWLYRRNRRREEEWLAELATRDNGQTSADLEAEPETPEARVTIRQARIRGRRLQ